MNFSDKRYGRISASKRNERRQYDSDYLLAQIKAPCLLKQA